MITAPDLPTLGLCSVLSSFAFAAVFLTLWRGRREARYLVHWAASSVIYVIVILAMEIAPPPFGLVPGCVLFAALPASNVFLVSGARVLEGRPAFARWMMIPSMVSALCFAVPLVLGKAGIAVPMTVGPALISAGLAFGMAVFGDALLRGAGPRGADDVLQDASDGARGRRIAGWALLGYLPGYALSIAAALTSFGGLDTLATFAMLSDQVLLVMINLGLLAMRGDRAMGALRESGMRDGLTGVRNRAWLAANALRPAITRAAVVIIDVDHFKSVNDRHGHAAGDAVLCALAERIAALCEPIGGYLVRLGGDEFLAILPDLDRAQLVRFAERARRAAGSSIPGVPTVTISLGVAMSRQAVPVLSDTMDEADRALYGAKAAGRDRVAA